MKDWVLLLLNYALFLVGAAIVVAVQQTTWGQILGGFPMPQMWIPVLVYWCVYREPHESAIMTYILTAMVSTQTSLPLTLFLTLNVSVFAILWLFKQRFFWSGPSFYTLMVGSACFLFFTLHWALSLMIEVNPVTDPDIFSWILSPLLTMLFSLIFYPIFQILDRWTHKHLPREASGGLL